MTFDSFLHKIEQIKGAKPVGIDAHRKMIPQERIPYLYAEDFSERNPKESAVMMLLYPKEQETYVLLIERATYKGIHSGQVGFPGGKYELNDQNLQHTALRETHEEVGIVEQDIQIIQPFTKIYIPPSNFYVQPYLGIAQKELLFVPDAFEVASIIELPLHVLLHEHIVKEVEMKTSYASWTHVPAFIYNNYTIWGATAMMLSELKETLKNAFKTYK
ncbi:MULTISPECIES: CoA pyrophosphatase [unclassified Myroides]|uniref:NUDIX hydrolase n=1 Tax=unclassified Myroides TaxID=2642485 RepID=UPI0015FC6067|nr:MULTISPECIES: CoA pyrophosphatase [unclassified Myroides]MBB1150193.1 CoA pyrophosphatase [Myroides sp. NP-2]MDM1407280.1 CoA pyrophosphatase [Myroides sp. DF42-4-2]